MATGMEKMIAAMLGISPEEMKATIGNAISLLSQLERRLNAIEAKVNDIHNHIHGEKTIVTIEHKEMNDA